jgi:purine catabolism regulator
VTPTLAALVDRPDLGLVVRAGAEHLDRPVQWVHTSELADPTGFLEGGELLLTTGLWVRSGAADYIKRLHAAGVAGLGFGTGLTHAAVPSTVIKAANAVGLPVIEVPRPVPFIAISKAVAKAVAAEEYAAVTRAYQAQRALTSAAVRPNGVTTVTRQLARRLDAWTVLLDPRGAVRAGDSPVLDELRSELPRFHAGPASLTYELDGAEITVQTLGAGERIRGFLAVGRATRLTPADQQVLTTAASLLTVSFERPHAVEAATRRLRGGLLRLLLAGETALVAEIAADLWGELPAAPVRIALASGPSQRRLSCALWGIVAARGAGRAGVARAARRRVRSGRVRRSRPGPQAGATGAGRGRADRPAAGAVRRPGRRRRAAAGRSRSRGRVRGPVARPAR